MERVGGIPDVAASTDLTPAVVQQAVLARRQRPADVVAVPLGGTYRWRRLRSAQRGQVIKRRGGLRRRVVGVGGQACYELTRQVEHHAGARNVGEVDPVGRRERAV